MRSSDVIHKPSFGLQPFDNVPAIHKSIIHTIHISAIKGNIRNKAKGQRLREKDFEPLTL